MKVRYTKSDKAPKDTLKRTNPTDAGMDICAAESYIIDPLERATVSTGVAIEIPEGYYARVAPRSGLASKHGIDVLAGVVDSGYRGEIRVVLHNTDKDSHFHVLAGDRIAQIIIEKHYNFEIEEVESLSDSDRGSSGFGSSG
jgi:dUTP pyrophosphatase